MKIDVTFLKSGVLALSLLLTACGEGDAQATPTLSVDAIQTFAVATFASGLTQTAVFAPTTTPSATATTSPTPAITSTFSTIAPFGGGVPSNPTASCFRLAFVSDVTIPDNTVLKADQAFTKTWRVRNTGSCAWDAGFKFSFTGGSDMKGVIYSLPNIVPINTEIDISVPMTAPTSSGSYQGNWRMSTAAGVFFGDEVYVQIVVGGPAAVGSPGATTATATVPAASPTNTEVPTNTKTP